MITREADCSVSFPMKTGFTLRSNWERELIAGGLKPCCSGRRHFYARRRNGAGAMGKGRISERSEGEINSALSPLLREVKPDFHWETDTTVRLSGNHCEYP